jgi:hypothetical protein
MLCTFERLLAARELWRVTSVVRGQKARSGVRATLPSNGKLYVVRRPVRKRADRIVSHTGFSRVLALIHVHERDDRS